MSKQTATEWLEKEFLKLEKTIGVHGVMYELLEQAKTIDKQNLINFTNDFINKHAFGDYDGRVQRNKTAEQYYNETFKKPC